MNNSANGLSTDRRRGIMPLKYKAFWDWMDTYPSSDTDWFSGKSDEGTITIVFAVDEDDDDIDRHIGEKG